MQISLRLPIASTLRSPRWGHSPGSWKVEAALALESQLFETVYNVDEATRLKRLSEMPRDQAGRRALARQRFAERSGRIAEQYRLDLITWYGAEKARKVQYAEAFEICEYGHQPSREERPFPFLPK
jgi:hypothetical protein